MSTDPKKSFVIFIPRIDWRKFLNLKFVLVIGLLATFTYWWMIIRPYFWVSNARVVAFSAVFSSEQGRVVEMGPDIGDAVKKGQLLFALDAELTQAMRNRLRYSIEALNEQIRLEKLRLEKAMQDYIKASTQSEMGYEISEPLQKHLTLLEDAQSKCEKASRELQSANAELTILELQEKKLRWEAPFDGIVMHRSSHVGASVPFGHPIYSIYDPKRIWVEMEIPESKIEQVKMGADVRVRFPAFPKKEWKGKIFFIGPSAEKGTFQVKISIEDKGPPLKPGLSAEVALRVH